MNKLFILCCAIAVAMAACCSGPQAQLDLDADGRLLRAEDAATLFDPAALDAFVDAAAGGNHDLRSIMVVQHGKVVAEEWFGPAAPDSLNIMYSVSKSFTATAVGFAIAEGLVSLDDRVVDLFPEKVPAEHSPNLDLMTVRNLLTMSTGQVKEPARGDDWIASFMASPVDDIPGANFRYNSMATFMLSAIVQKTSGQKLSDYLAPRLFEPLAIEGYRWDENPDGICVGGWGLWIKTEDMAKFGQLFLRKGVWNGGQLLPEGWVEEASTSKIASGPAGHEADRAPDNDWSQGYGYQMWRCSPTGVYRADGARGQYIIVIPDRDAVVAITSNTDDMPGEIALVWQHILPALK